MCDLRFARGLQGAVSRQVRWQLSGRPALPAAPPTLAALGVKERLQTRWAEVHEEEEEGDIEKRAQSQGDGKAMKNVRAGAGDKSCPVPASEGGFVSPRQRVFFASLNRCECQHLCDPGIHASR